MKKRLKVAFLILIPIIIDQFIKFLITLHTNLDISLVPGILKLSYIRNTGGAYGLGADSILVLIGINILLIIFITRYLMKNYRTLEKNLKIGLLLILSGGISNLIDRLFRGYVIDYIDVSEFIDFPVFNVADVSIVIGVIVMIVTILISTVKSQEENKKKG